MSRRIDALIAEYLFKKCFKAEHEIITTEGGAARMINPTPNYSTQIEAAWLVVEKMGMFHMTKGVQGFFCAFAVHFDEEYGTGIRKIEAQAETMPMAICLAALKALGVDESHFKDRGGEK